MLSGGAGISDLVAGGGRHLVVTAHPDDETISFGGALCALEHVTILQLTDGVNDDTPDRHAHMLRRQQERQAAFAAAGWPWTVVDCGVTGRTVHHALARLLPTVRHFLMYVDAVWTHPYEGGHLDHDSAAWLVQTACASLGAAAPCRMEFASYYGIPGGLSVFGRFWPDQSATWPALQAEALARKRAAIAAYVSQASILRKFKTIAIEPYRLAPVYDFAQPPPAPVCRWDAKGYQPRSDAWRAAVLGTAA